VGIGVPFKRTTDVVTKFPPRKATVVSGIPTARALGLTKERVGGGAWRVTWRPWEVPPPGLPFATVTVAVPGVAVWLAGTMAVSVVASTRVVAIGVPFHRTLLGVVPPRNPDPVTVRVRLPLPARALVGVTLASVGRGLEIVTVRLGDVPPPGAGVLTATGTDAAAAQALGPRVIWRSVGLP
jgi:hypothetical protein